MGHEQQERRGRSGGAGHLLLFPFMAQGHLIPFLNLAKRFEILGQRGGGSSQRRLEVTIVSTPRNVASLRRALPAGSSIGFADLPFSPTDHGLPPGTENLDVVPLDATPAFFFATEQLRPSFDKLLAELVEREGRNNVCVFADMFLGWTAESARALGVQHRMFLTSGAYASAVTFSIWLRPPSFPRPAAPDDEQALLDFPDVRVRYAEFMNVVVREDYASNPMLAYLCRMITLHFRHSGGIVVNTSEEIEPKGLHLIANLSGLPTFAVGPLIGGRTAANNNTAPDQDMCTKFLDSKPQASVLYVSFGSQNSIPASQMMDLARGLEASGRPFIWVVRPPVEYNGAKGFRAEWLPDGFEERVAAAGQGVVVVRGWAPQVRILAHASTGAFLSHCGWNSALESLWHGVPVVAWPLVADQLFGSRVLLELGVGVEVASGRMVGGLGSKGWESVRDVVETVLGDGDKARDMRRKAAEIKKLARAAVGVGDGDDGKGKAKGSSVLAMERLLDSAFD